ncbi:DNA-binding PadR family transcriptional regulator [Streptosporangium album]|uniref:DNA-binding PadR family transcriptional regulator n=1 Tax=Streptosporangium album TaxID=47479 RepID=A0A7W7S566_9ACTN|nr:helix-turn-helix transcriptional regulator [Streptosporangium album]MBB4943717.1 DNA-binding PadR family transcriptional regulator [Streptosporangium album]
MKEWSGQTDGTPGAGGTVNAGAPLGQTEILLLSVLKQGPLHGYAIVEALRERGAGTLKMPTGTLYPALRRLEQEGYLAGEWGTVGGRRRRTYRLTSFGRTALAGERPAWREFVGTIGTVPEPRATWWRARADG